jgi:hypothetical protein
MSNFTDAEIAAFLDEALEPARSAKFESALRDDEDLRQRLITVRGRETAGLHTVGAIWRRRRLSCPDRTQLGQFVLGTIDEDHADYIQFHIKDIGCRYCEANLADLQAASQKTRQSTQRRQRYFQTSAGYLKR